jgi:hypothetical protein
MFYALYVIAGLVVFAVIVVLILAAMKPDTFRLQRSAGIKAAPEKIFPLLNDFHRWGIWSPWDKMDPAMQRTFTGAPAGKGAIYEWNGNKKVGQGRMEILDSSPSSKVVVKLDFIKPFEGHNTAEFTLVPAGDTTNVTWSMHGPTPFGMKIFHVFVNMDRLVGKDFEAGLANLKSAVE